MTPLRGTVRTDDHGGVVVTLRCRCATVRRTVTTWEDRDEIVDVLLKEHHRVAPLCRHRRLEVLP